MLALILLVLAVVGAWWWKHPSVHQAIPYDEPAVALPGQVSMAKPHPMSESLPAVPAGESPDRCDIAMHDAFNVRARQLALRDDANSQLGYALAIPYEAPADFERADPVAMKRNVEQRLAKQQRAFIHVAELAPDRPDLLFLAAASCWDSDLCAGHHPPLVA